MQRSPPPPPLLSVHSSLLIVLTTGVLATASGAVTGGSGGTSGCPHPAVPAGASYFNVSGGLGADSWRIKYDCDIGNNTFYVIIINYFKIKNILVVLF